MNWTNQTFKQLAERAEERVRTTPTGIEMISCKPEKKKAASYKPQAASALKRTQLKGRIKT